MSERVTLPDGKILDGPGLIRKPRIGETLLSRRTGRRLIVDHFDGVSPNILHYRYENGGEGCFIWRFHDGTLNLVVRHLDVDPPPEEKTS